MLYYVRALVERRARVALLHEELVKLIDVAKDVADKYSAGRPTSYGEEDVQKATDQWTMVFDRAYKAIKATLAEEEE